MSIRTKCEYLFFISFIVQSGHRHKVGISSYADIFQVIRYIKQEAHQSILTEHKTNEYRIFCEKDLWKYSIQSLKTTDSVLLNQFIRDNGRCDIPHAA